MFTYKIIVLIRLAHKIVVAHDDDNNRVHFHTNLCEGHLVLRHHASTIEKSSFVLRYCVSTAIWENALAHARSQRN